MTESPRVEPLRFDRIEEVVDVIRANGGRVSAARRLVLESLFEADGPMSADWIAAELARRGPALELTSVYRNLERLEGLGVLRHVHLGHGPGLYSLIGRGEREYLSCERCNRVTSVEPRELDAIRRQIRKRFGYSTRFTHFPIMGLCPSCAAEVEGSAEPAGDHQQEHSHGDRIHSHPHREEHDHGEGGRHRHEHDQGAAE